MSPKISVVMAVYNGQTYLAAAVESILQQTWADFEFIILDDASTDETPIILADYAAQDKRIRLIHNAENIGLTKSLNIGLRAAEGDYISRQDADDISLPTRFAQQLAYFEAYPQTVLLSANADAINALVEKIGELRRAQPPEVVNWLLHFYNHVGVHSLTMFPRQLVLDLGGYNETRRYSQDYELWLRLMKHGEVAILPDVLLLSRQHPENISQTKTGEQTQQSLEDSLAALEHQISAEELALLRGFWLEPFPPVATAARVHEILRMVYQKHADPSQKIRQYIYQRWAGWLRSVSLRRETMNKMRLAIYSGRWS